MLEAFHISASSMQAHQTYVDVLANNLANVNTTAFKKSSVAFQDLVYSELLATQRLRGGDEIPVSRGMGTVASSTEKIFSQGETKATERDLDLAIQGKGFFEVLMPDGTYGYTRSGNFQIDRDGFLVTPDGHQLSPAIQVPSDAKALLISSAGQVSVTTPDSTTPIEIGQLELAGFMSPSGLTPLGGNLYGISSASGDAYYGDPGQEGFGSVEQGYLESSNVNLIEELTNLMLAQRGYETNAKVIQAADEMLGIVNSLRR